VKILLTGRNGQVGWELERALQPLGDVVAVDRAGLDLADRDAIRRVVRSERPGVIINAAAYTAVDRAESEPDLAQAINGQAPAVMADEAHRIGALLVHYSTDYVFDGAKPIPYEEDDQTHPISVYGATKLAGETAIRDSGCRHLILRTSWVYAARGANFLLTMLRLFAEREEVRVVSDQVGSPTWSRAIALATVELVRGRAYEQDPLLHLTASGYASWHDFAAAILAHTASWRSRQPNLVSIGSGEYPSAARRPLSSRLSTRRAERRLGHALPEWQRSLRECLAEISP
jgi:dTDP-4-dehydrorhamnose reductase